MNRKIGAGIGIRRLHLRKDRLCPHQIPARTGQGFGEIGDRIVVERFPSNQVERNLQRRDIIFGNGWSASQRALGDVEALISMLLLRNGSRVIDRDQNRRGFGVLGKNSRTSARYFSVRGTTMRRARTSLLSSARRTSAGARSLNETPARSRS